MFNLKFISISHAKRDRHLVNECCIWYFIHLVIGHVLALQKSKAFRRRIWLQHIDAKQMTAQASIVFSFFFFVFFTLRRNLREGTTNTQHTNSVTQHDLKMSVHLCWSKWRPVKSIHLHVPLLRVDKCANIIFNDLPIYMDLADDRDHGQWSSLLCSDVSCAVHLAQNALSDFN